MIKKFSMVCALLLGTVPGIASASIDGWLSGIQLGRFDADYKADNQGYSTIGSAMTTLGSAATKTDEGLYAGRIYLGYSFNQYLQAELGYTKFQDFKFSNIYGVNNANVILNLQSYDLVGMIKWPLNERFDVYAKLGATLNFKGTAANQTARTIPVTGGVLPLPDNDARLYRAIYGVGVTYDVNPTFSVDVGWSRIDGQGSWKATDFGFIGIVYHFDQFLTS